MSSDVFVPGRKQGKQEAVEADAIRKVQLHADGLRKARNVCSEAMEARDRVLAGVVQAYGWQSFGYSSLSAFLDSDDCPISKARWYSSVASKFDDVEPSDVGDLMAAQGCYEATQRLVESNNERLSGSLLAARGLGVRLLVLAGVCGFSVAAVSNRLTRVDRPI